MNTEKEHCIVVANATALYTRTAGRFEIFQRGRHHIIL